jgi:hypothetical protein
MSSKPKGQATILVVGGALEALNGEHDIIRLVLNRRKGFIKLAIRFGIHKTFLSKFVRYS